MTSKTSGRALNNALLMQCIIIMGVFWGFYARAAAPLSADPCRFVQNEIVNASCRDQAGLTASDRGAVFEGPAHCKYLVSLEALCLGKINFALTHLKEIASAGHIYANFILGNYYRTGQFDDQTGIYFLTPWSHLGTNVWPRFGNTAVWQAVSNQSHFNLSLSYYEQAGHFYKQAVYSGRAGLLNDYWEEEDFIPAFIFANALSMSIEKYRRMLSAVIDGVIIYPIDSIGLIQKIKTTSQDCLNQAAKGYDLKAYDYKEKALFWKHRAFQAVAGAVKNYCQAAGEFSKKVYGLEQKRLHIVQTSRYEPVVFLADEPKQTRLVYQIAQEIDRMLEASHIVFMQMHPHKLWSLKYN